MLRQDPLSLQYQTLQFLGAFLDGSIEGGSTSPMPVSAAAPIQRRHT